MEGIHLLLPVFDATRSAGQVALGDGEKASPVVNLYAAPAVASRWQFGPDYYVQALSARGELGVGVELAD